MTQSATTRRVFGPFNRVEGDLEVQVEVQHGEVTAAWVNSPLYRGFEQILAGKDPADALVITPRICGICSVAQSVAAARALAQAQGCEMAPNGALASNLILACENLSDHLSHFYLFFMPDFARPAYQQHSWYAPIRERFAAKSGTATAELLPARADFLHLTGLLAGKWPHSLALQPGGTTRAIEPRERLRLLSIIAGMRRFLERCLFGDSLEAVCNLTKPEALWDWAESHRDSDFGRFLMLASELKLSALGRATDSFMSYGAYAGLESSPLFAAGTWCGDREALRQEAISEDISHSWMRSQQSAQHPYTGSTQPDADAADGYSWCKAPRYDGAVMEVGALARQVVNRQPLIQALVSADGGNVCHRVIARLLELALLIPVMEDWARMLQPGQIFCQHGRMPEEAEGMGLVEAARGSLGHWLRIQRGQIQNYQIIAPTTWNFSPRDRHGIPGALEQALVGTPVDADGCDSVSIQHVVRSFDPCMVCTVH